MTDPDQLLALAAQSLVRAIDNDEEGNNLGGYDHLAEELAALRAALATRPEPLFKGTVADFIRRFDSLEQPPLVRALDLIEVYRQGAAAGSATRAESPSKCPVCEDRRPCETCNHGARYQP
jgi:hypothetical protein